jgi:hypothetical protein
MDPVQQGCGVGHRELRPVDAHLPALFSALGHHVVGELQDLVAPAWVSAGRSSQVPAVYDQFAQHHSAGHRGLQVPGLPMRVTPSHAPGSLHDATMRSVCASNRVVARPDRVHRLTG